MATTLQSAYEFRKEIAKKISDVLDSCDCHAYQAGQNRNQPCIHDEILRQLGKEYEEATMKVREERFELRKDRLHFRNRRERLFSLVEFSQVAKIPAPIIEGYESGHINLPDESVNKLLNILSTRESSWMAHVN